MSAERTPWHAAQARRIEEARQRLPRLPVRTQRLLGTELVSLGQMVEFVDPETVRRNGGVMPYLDREIDDLVAEIVVLADALERS